MPFARTTSQCEPINRSPPPGAGGLLAKLLQVHFACHAPECETRLVTGTQPGLKHDDEQHHPRPALAGLPRQSPCAHCPFPSCHLVEKPLSSCTPFRLVRASPPPNHTPNDRFCHITPRQSRCAHCPFPSCLLVEKGPIGTARRRTTERGWSLRRWDPTKLPSESHYHGNYGRIYQLRVFAAIVCFGFSGRALQGKYVPANDATGATWAPPRPRCLRVPRIQAHFSHARAGGAAPGAVQCERGQCERGGFQTFPAFAAH